MRKVEVTIKHAMNDDGNQITVKVPSTASMKDTTVSRLWLKSIESSGKPIEIS